MVQSNGQLNDELRDSLDELKTFPVQVKEFAPGTASSGRRAAAGRLGQVAERTIRDILGWRPKVNDSSGFAGALDQAFAARDLGGYTHWSWRQRGLSVRADLGAITGAQASIYARARSALAESIELLNGLKSLRVDADVEDSEAISAIIRDQLGQLVDELGAEGGPVVQHVDQLLLLLIDYKPNGVPAFPQPDTVSGTLGTLRDRFGLEPERANTVEEEHNLSNFITLVEQIGSLMLSWDARRKSFFRDNPEVFFGTQLVQLDRALEVVVESVHETENVMDSVYLGADERQATLLKLDDGAPITISELLGWVERLAGEEGPRIIKDSGKDGVELDFVPKLTEVARLVGLAVKLADAPPDATPGPPHTNGLAAARSNPGTPPRLPDGFRSARVRFALQQLDAQLATALSLATPIRRTPAPPAPTPTPPRIFTIAPSNGRQGTQVPSEVLGQGFEHGAGVFLVRDDTPDEIPGRPRGDATIGTLPVTFDLTGARLGPWRVVVRNPGGSAANWETGRFYVDPPPEPPIALQIDDVQPTQGITGDEPITISITGQGIDHGATARLERNGGVDVNLDVVDVAGDGKSLKCTLKLKNAPAGEFQVHVANPDDEQALWRGGYFTIRAQAEEPSRSGGRPNISKVDSINLDLSAGPIELQITGTGLRTGAKKSIVTLRPESSVRAEGIEGTIERVSDDGSTIVVAFDQTRLEAGAWQLRVTNPGQGARNWRESIHLTGEAAGPEE